MYLKELWANKDSFHAIKFNRGLNFIVGGMGETNKKDGTYNGVGKSLIVRILHFCLGCKNISSFEKMLNDWVFYLKFEIDDVEYVVSRACKCQEKLVLNGTNMTLSEFNNFMGENIFFLSKNKYPYLSYRNLISQYIRPGKYSYTSYDKYQKKETEYSKNVNNAYLLGLDVGLYNKKRELIEEKKRTESAKSIFERDATIKKYYSNEGKIDVKIIDLEKKITELDTEIKAFRIAENYYELRQNADMQQEELNNIENEIMIIDNALENINESLEIKLGTSLEEIIKMYGEAARVFDSTILKKIEEVENFHKQLLINRQKRLYKQKETFEETKAQKEKKREELSVELNNSLSLLNASGALEEYNALNEKLNQYRNELDKIKKYKEILQEYKEKISSLKIKIEEANAEADRYLIDEKDVIERNIIVFNELSKRFFKSKLSGIEISNDSGSGTNRFKIKADIQDDTSDGVNGVKIFCYDYTKAINSFNSKVKFIFHDSRLFSDVDPRQKAEFIRIAREYSDKANIQYIASMNEDFLGSVKDVLENDEYKEIENIVKSNTVLKLTDDDEKGKLLGVQLNIKYDE